jgi:cephalosporin hydroxylase
MVSDGEFWRDVASGIEGWLIEHDALVTAMLLRLQESSTRGPKPLLEIGVYAGKYLTLLMDSGTRTGSTVLGIDTFQFRDRAGVVAGLQAAVPALMPCLKLHSGSSRDLDAADVLDMLGGAPRFVSVDGSHEFADVLHDLRLVDSVLDDAGVVAVDDFLNPLTLGVNRAVNVFMESRPALAGVACGANKLYLARPDVASRYRDHLEAHLMATSAPYGEVFRARLATWRGLVEQDFFGTPLLLYGHGA